MTKDEALRLALEALEKTQSALARCIGPHKSEEGDRHRALAHSRTTITAIKAALEAKDEPVGLIESLKDAKPCCGQYETCWRACTPRGKFIGHRDAQRTWQGLTDEEVKDIVWNLPFEPSQEHIRAIEAKLKEKNT